jgi:hypothetical protein
MKFTVSECFDVQLSESGKFLFIYNFINISYLIYLFIVIELNEICQDDENNIES